MRTSIFAFVALSLLPVCDGAAQGRVPLLPATRIRYVLPPATQPMEAEIVIRRGDSLWVRSLEMGTTRAFALGALTSLEVSRGQDGHALRGAGVGLLTGAAIGAVVGYATGDNPNSSQGFGPSGPGFSAAAVAIAGGLFGAGNGAIFGAADKTDRWEPVLLTSVRGIAMQPGHRVRTFGLAVRYKIF